MLRGKADAFEKIGFCCGTVAAVCDGHRPNFAQFAGKGDTSSVQDLCCDGSRACDHVMFVVAPMQCYLLLARVVALRASRMTVLCFRRLHVQVGAKDLTGSHADGEDNTQVAIVRQGKILAHLNTDCTAHLNCFMTATTCHKLYTSLLV